jgi:hypothetical protein
MPSKIAIEVVGSSPSTGSSLLISVNEGLTLDCGSHSRFLNSGLTDAGGASFIAVGIYNVGASSVPVAELKCGANLFLLLSAQLLEGFNAALWPADELNNGDNEQ